MFFKLKRLPWRFNCKESACNAGDAGSIPGSGRSPGKGTGNILQYSHLVNSMDRGAWWGTVHGVAKESGMTWQLNNNKMPNQTLEASLFLFTHFVFSSSILVSRTVSFYMRLHFNVIFFIFHVFSRGTIWVPSQLLFLEHLSLKITIYL